MKSKTLSRGAKQRKAEAEKLAKQFSEYQTIGIINLHKLPASQLMEIRSKLSGKALIKVTKKSVILNALSFGGLNSLIPYVKEEPALLLSKYHPLKLADEISASKSFAAAKPGDIPSSDIWIRAGPTPFAPGPAIGELQRAGLQVAVEGSKIVIKSDKILVPAGQSIKKEQADIMTKLGLKPIEIGLNVLAAWDGKTIFEKDILFKPSKLWIEEMLSGRNSGLALALTLAWPVSDIMPILISKGYNHAISLSIATNWPTSETISIMLAKAASQAKIISEQI